jgi:predicted Zn-dependent peptidase
LPADLRERQGLTYAVYADHVIWQPQLALRIRGSARYPQVHALLQGIRDHVRASFSDGGITQEEFERARQQLLWRLRVRQTFLPGHLDRVFRMVSHRWPEDIRDIERLTWPRFLDELAHLRQKPQWIFVAGDRNAMKHQLCEYFTKCIFIK